MTVTYAHSPSNLGTLSFWSIKLTSFSLHVILHRIIYSATLLFQYSSAIWSIIRVCCSLPLSDVGNLMKHSDYRFSCKYLTGNSTRILKQSLGRTCSMIKTWSEMIIQAFGYALEPNGREIKNLIAMALLVSRAKKKPLDEETIRLLQSMNGSISTWWGFYLSPSLCLCSHSGI